MEAIAIIVLLTKAAGSARGAASDDNGFSPAHCLRGTSSGTCEGNDRDKHQHRVEPSRPTNCVPAEAAPEDVAHADTVAGEGTANSISRAGVYTPPFPAVKPRAALLRPHDDPRPGLRAPQSRPSGARASGVPPGQAHDFRGDSLPTSATLPEPRPVPRPPVA